MKDGDKKVINLFLRYIFMIILGLGNLVVFYEFLTPLTVKSIQGILSIFYDSVDTIGSWIYFNGISVEIIPACVAGAAFYLLFILIFSTPGIKPRDRAYVVLYSFALLFIFNIIRILFLITMFGISYFETIHWIFWNIISTIVVVGIWFYMVKKFNIKETPVYSDVRYIKSLTKRKSSSVSNKRKIFAKKSRASSRKKGRKSKRGKKK